MNPKSKKRTFQKMQFSDEEIRDQIEEEVREIRERDLTQVQQQQMILNLYNQHKKEKKKRKILQQDHQPKKITKQPHYQIEEDDQEQGQIHQPKPNQMIPQQLEEQFSIRDLGDHIRPITLTRNRIQNLLNSPKFQKLIKGCFVRYQNDKASANSYMIAQVIGVTEGPKQYYVGSIKTKLLLKLQQTQQTVVTLSIQFITNKHPPGVLEIQRWLRSNRNKMPKDTQLKEKKQQHDKLLNQQRSSQQIDNYILDRARKIASNTEEAKQDVGNLVQFMVRRLHHLQIKEQQLGDLKDAADVTQKQKQSIGVDKKKVTIQKIQTQQIISKLKSIAAEQKKIQGEKKLQAKLASNQAEKKYIWPLDEKRVDQINEKVKARIALLSTYEGYNTIKNSIIEMHKNFQFPL